MTTYIFCAFSCKWTNAVLNNLREINKTFWFDNFELLLEFLHVLLLLGECLWFWLLWNHPHGLPATKPISHTTAHARTRASRSPRAHGLDFFSWRWEARGAIGPASSSTHAALGGAGFFISTPARSPYHLRARILHGTYRPTPTVPLIGHAWGEVLSKYQWRHVACGFELSSYAWWTLGLPRKSWGLREVVANTNDVDVRWKTCWPDGWFVRDTLGVNSFVADLCSNNYLASRLPYAMYANRSRWTKVHWLRK